MKSETQNLKASAAVAHGAQKSACILKPVQELGAILYIQKVCEKAFVISEKNVHAYDYSTMDKVLASSFNLLMLCYKASSAESEIERTAIRASIKAELQLLCVIVLLAFGIDIFGLENVAAGSVFINNTKANLYLLFLVQMLTLAQAIVCFKLHHNFMDSNFLVVCR